MRVCHVTTAHPVHDTRILKRECASLAAAGAEVTLVATADHEEEFAGVHIVPVSARGDSFRERRFDRPRRAAALARELRADLYHFHDPELIPPMRALARELDVPVIWDAHENYVSTIRHFNPTGVPFGGIAAAAYFDRLERRACMKEFAGVVTITPVMAARYERWQVPTAVVGNFVDLGQLYSGDVAARTTRPRFISTGEQFADRGVLEMARAFASLRQRVECEVAFWGRFSPVELEAQLRAAADPRRQHPGDVLVGGPYSWHELVGELIPTGWAGCVLFQSGHSNNLDGLPNRFFEYWANAVPVIATAGSEVARLVAETGGGIVIPDCTVEAITAAFEAIAADRGAAERMGQAGQRAVRERYNWDAAFRNLIALYARVGMPVDSKSRTRSVR